MTRHSASKPPLDEPDEPREPVDPSPDSPFFLKLVASPVGSLYIVSDGTAITLLSIEPGELLPAERALENSNDVLELAATQLLEYFDGARRGFDVPIAAKGTPFQQAVWQQLRDTPWGSVTSYGAIGAATGRPAAGRAVGAAIAANPIPLLVPCHRVLAAGGRITGYTQGAGVATKAWLLEHEGIPYRLPSEQQPASDDEVELVWPAW